MNWKELDLNIKSFAAQINAPVSEKDIAFISGKITVYEFSEGDKIFYSIKHTKPESDSANKFHIKSLLAVKPIKIKASNNIFGKPKLKIKGYIPSDIKKQIEDLQNKITNFKWDIIPNKDQSKHWLQFHTSDIDISRETMLQIRSIHKKLNAH